MDANQWITRNVRQTILLSFCCALGDIYLATKEGNTTNAQGDGAVVQRLTSVSAMIDKLGGLKPYLADKAK